MAYRYKTNFYRIPVMGEGDMLTEEQEWLQMSAIDSLLYAANFGCTKAFLEEGEYSLSWNESHSECRLVIRPANKDGFSLMGIINGRLFYSSSDLSIGILYGGTTYYVYVEYDSMLERDTKGFLVKAYLQRQIENEQRMALCIVNTIDDTIFTDVNKVYAKNLLAHTMDTTNPHGKTLTQDVMNVTEKMTVRGGDINGCVYMDAVSAGHGGYVDVNLNEGMEPLFATVVPDSLGAGEIAVEIVENRIRVFNSGNAGVALKIRIDLK